MLHLKIFLQRNKYEMLLVALLQHLFIGIILEDLSFYTRVIWPVNMLILGVASVGVFIEKGKWKNMLRNLLLLLVVGLPIALPFMSGFAWFMPFLGIAYVGFFLFIFWEIIRFLISPGYINADIISASACGSFLIIEILVFLMQTMYYMDPGCFNGIDGSSHGAIFMDLVYFSSIAFTSIGFGDITPNAHYTKLITSFFGMAGQFYSVVLIGILISKFATKPEKKQDPQEQDEERGSDMLPNS